MEKQEEEQETEMEKTRMQWELSSGRAPGEIKQQDRDDDYVESFEGFLRPSESLFCFRKCHMKNALAVQMPALCMGLPVGWGRLGKNSLPLSMVVLLVEISI